MKKSDFKVALCYNMRENHEVSLKDEKIAEFDSRDTIMEIKKSLVEIGFKTFLIEFDSNFVENLKKINPNLVFNIVEGFQGEDRESQAPAIYEFLGIPYTGSGPLGHALSLNKLMGKFVMEQNNIKTAPYDVFYTPIEQDTKINVKFPAIVKPIHEGSSIGIHNDAIVRDEKQLIYQVNRVISNYNQPALVEEFIIGREFNQAIIGNENPILFPIVEIDYSYLPNHIEKFSSFEVKTELDDPNSTICPAQITKEEENKITKATLGAFYALNIKDYCRIDLRLGVDGEVYILEINSIPGIAPGIEENNSMPKAIRTYGWNYTQMINAIVEASCLRYNIRFHEMNNEY